MTSFNLFLNNFHFVRPYWLLAIIGLFFVLWLLKKHRFYQSPWQQFLPKHLSQVLVEGNSSTQKTTTEKGFLQQGGLIKPFLIGLLAIIALAGPAWQKLPQPVYQTERGSVLIMDMSYSMYATDIKPNRLTRARFKAIDLLNKINEGDTGLIAYAGDAFIISPLTQDIKNIELLLPSLTPEIMPELGANPLAALTLAHEMLLNAGHLNGDIYWFTDDVDNDEITDIYDWSNEFGHQLNILGIGSDRGAPITLPSGELLKDHSGAIVVPRLPSQKLSSLAARGHGYYQTISNDDSDIDNLVLKDKFLNKNEQKNNSKKQQSQQMGDQWQEQGAWLLLLVLPLMLSYFRRGGAVLMLPLTCLPLLFLLTFPLLSPASFAAENDGKLAIQPNKQISTTQNLWNNLWQTSDQQAQQQYNQENYQAAAGQFESAQWQGSAHYKDGNYQAALASFKQGEQAGSANSLYNQGNALAQMQQYEQAIESYEQALTKNPDLQDAKDNIEKIKQQQKQEQQQQEQQQGDQSQDDQSKEKQPTDKQSQDGQQQDKNEQAEDQQQGDQEQESPQQQNDPSSESEEQPQQNETQESDKAQQDKEAKEKQQEQQQKAEHSEQQDKQNEQKTAAQIAAEQQAKETEQKHQQLLNKVTDDPYLLLRNKMQLEYQKRKQDGASRGVKKKW
ncbi:MAG: VWA domain-containing protein [Colwellia sp.]|nr:VWA domain-containing protein [Colwellia sp.]